MPTADRRIPITVLAGQSNANANALVVEVFRATVAAGGMMVHVAENGSALDAGVPTASGHWNAASADQAMGENLAILFRQLTSILDPASPSHVPGAYLENIVWVQGESDAYLTSAARDYGANLRAFHAALTARFGAHDLIISGLSDAPDNNHSFSGNHAGNWDRIQNQQTALAWSTESVRIVDPDSVARLAGIAAADMFRDDWIHYDDATGFGARLGRALADMAFDDGNPAAAMAASRAVVGTSGNDVFTLGMAAFAQVLAGPGEDRAVITGSASLTVIEATATSTRIIAGTAAQPRILDLLRVESLQLGSGQDVVRLAGGVARLATGAGNDTVQGAAQAEVVWLGDGRDVANGGRRNDTLAGGDGADALQGGHGYDWLRGGAGADTFIFGACSGVDRITDFNPAQDQIGLWDATWREVTLRQSGQDVIITTDTSGLRVEDVLVTDLQKSDLLFF